MLLRCTHSYRGKTFNPLCYKGLEVLLVLLHTVMFCADLGHLLEGLLEIDLRHIVASFMIAGGAD